ncbi:hypothetical protein C8F01DRAFT_1094630 [Mycena amicta]|nr:hypothetical protein C8F01DRAFT_1094630 [Mycena amicta]
MPRREIILSRGDAHKQDLLVDAVNLFYTQCEPADGHKDFPEGHTHLFYAVHTPALVSDTINSMKKQLILQQPVSCTRVERVLASPAVPVIIASCDYHKQNFLWGMHTCAAQHTTAVVSAPLYPTNTGVRSTSSHEKEFKADRSQSEFFITSYVDYMALSPQEAMDIFQSRSFAIYGYPSEVKTFVEALKDMQNLDTRIEFQANLGPDQHLEQVGIPNPTTEHYQFPTSAPLESHQRAVKQTSTLPSLPQRALLLEHLQWGIAGNAGAKSEPHQDTGSDTYLIVQNCEDEDDELGKAWMVSHPGRRGTNWNRHSGNLRSCKMMVDWNPHDSSTNVMETEVLYLGPHMILLKSLQNHARWDMAPCHGDDGCVIRGGHGFLIFSVDRYIHADLHAILAGHILTNTKHPDACWLCPRMLLHSMTRPASRSPDAHTLDLIQQAHLQKFTPLVVFCALLPALNEHNYKLAAEQHLPGLPIFLRRPVPICLETPQRHP